jgi:hypothetical protein
MTAVKKPAGRRAVFDASFGEQLLNNGKPSGVYLSQPFTYDFPKIEDFKRFCSRVRKGFLYLEKGFKQVLLAATLRPHRVPTGLLCMENTFVLLLCTDVWFATCWAPRSKGDSLGIITV